MKRLAALTVAAALLGAACGGDGADDPVSLTLVTHDSFAYTEAVLQQFTTDTGIDVTVVRGADAGSVVNRAILTKDDPEGDVLWGVDNTLLSRALDEAIFTPYQSQVLLEAAPGATELDPTGTVTPVDTGEVCVNGDLAGLTDRGLAMPTSLADLADPRFRDLLVVQNPATSSPGLAFLLATIAEFGDDGWQEYWRQLRDNGVQVVDGWTEAYTVAFSGPSGKGPRPLVVSYATSPVAELVFAADPKPTEPPTATMTAGCFRQVEYAGILDGTDHLDEARRLVDFLVSRPFQEDMPLNMFVRPVRPDATLPPEFERFVPEVETGDQVPPRDIEEHRDRWIDEWTTVVLR